MRWTNFGVGLALVALLFGSLGAGLAQGEVSEIDRHVRLELGTTSDFGGGDYVALNMTQNETLAFFGVVYGTEEDPNAVILVSAYIAYLGGAEIRDENGGIMATVPMPVLRVYAQGLALLVEFNDTGFPSSQGRIGAGNGVFDFAKSSDDMMDFDVSATEPIYKAVSLERAWERSDVVETSTVGNGSAKEWTFSLTARNVTYDRIWDRQPGFFDDGSRPGTLEDGVIEEVTFVFRVGARVDEVGVMVPFYRVTLGNDSIIDSEEIEPRFYEGVSLSADFKYDHVIKGWDFTAKSETSKLMLESLIIFGTYIPGPVNNWLDAQFVEGYVEDGTGVAELETFTGDVIDLESNDDIPPEATILAKDSISFRDNWRKNGELTWVSNVTVDEEEKEMSFQIHAGTNGLRITNEKDDKFRGVVLLGGYIYPAGSDIYHDPSYSVQAILVDIQPEFNLAPFVFVGIASVATLGLMGTAIHLRRRSKRRRIPPAFGRLY
ncbi:MAG: hypothetical protein V3W22_02040 [Thermoplasmata archaeon]